MIRQIIAFDTKDFYDIQKATKIEIKWYIGNYDKVDIGTSIVCLTLHGYDIPQSYVIKSNYKGFCRVLNPETVFIHFPEENLAIIVDKEIDMLYPYKLDKTNDSFTNEVIIDWKQISGFNTSVGIPLVKNGKKPLYLSNSFFNGKLLLSFCFDIRHIKFKKGDTISFKFCSGNIIDFTLDSKPVKITDKIILPEEDNNYIMSVNEETLLDESFILGYSSLIIKIKKSFRKYTFALSTKELLLFLSETLNMIRITFNSEGGTHIDIDIQSHVMNKDVCPIIIKDMFIKLVEEISKFDTSYSLEKLENIKESTSCSTIKEDPCFVYLMHDEANGFYKIGMSNNPIYREGTLQSEKPTIKLIASHKYPSRKFASALEAALHNLYSNLHVRGEWYRLRDEDVNEIIEGLK